MSRQAQDIDTRSGQRSRSNTTSFSSFPWRRRPDAPPTTSVPSVSPHSLPLEELIQALTPPAVPSLGHARVLASMLSTSSPLPRRAALNPVLASLCDVKSPVAVQVAGYDIVSAYCENNEAPPVTTSDRLSYFALFRGSTTPWGFELWEPRFKALRALTKFGTDIVGIELDFLEVFKSWINGAFEGLMKADGVVDRAERAERERSVDIFAEFLAGVLSDVETIARIPEENLAAVLDFYAGLVDRSILFRNKNRYQEPPSSSSTTDLPSSNDSPSRTPGLSHRRNLSSISAMSIPLQNPIAPSVPSSTKHPADLAISIYLDHLSSRLKTLSPAYLNSILPLLFRALAFCSSPLPRLSLSPHPAKKATPEDKVTRTLHTLFSGPYSSTCMRILKHHLFPPTDFADYDAKSSEIVPEIRKPIQTSLGAHRTFRNYVRRALATRLARAYISREASLSYSPSGAPGNLNLERDLMERAWPKEDYTSSALGLGRNGWDAARLGRVLTSSVQAWVWWQPYGGEESYLQQVRDGKEDILEEAAGVLKDIWQELDSRAEEDKGELDEEEACVIGETLQKLVEYLPLRYQGGTPLILPLSESPTLSTPLLRSLSALLSRDHAIPTSPLLSTILIHMADNLTDADTAKLPQIMTEQHDLYPTSPEWLENWQKLLINRVLVNTHRPLTRRAVMEALASVHESVKDMKVYREPLVDMVLEFCERSLQDDGDKDVGHVAWKILGEEVVLRTVECDDKEDDSTISKYIDILVAAASEPESDEEEDMGDAASVYASDHSPSPIAPQSSVVSPTLSRTQSEHPTPTKEREKENSSLPSVMSIFSSLTAGHPSRSHSIPVQTSEDVPGDPPILSHTLETPSQSRIPRVVAAVSAFIAIFSQMTFTPFVLEERNVNLAIRVFLIMVKIVIEGKSTRARLTALQFLMRLRADRDHRLYFARETPHHVVMLSGFIYRQPHAFTSSGSTENIDPKIFGDPFEHSNVRPPVSKERDGRQLSRGKDTGNKPSPSTGTTSRSRSRATVVLPSHPIPQTQMPLWRVYETLPFPVADADPSEGLVIYHTDSPGGRPVLPISSYLSAVVGILEKETDWEILSYVLCHLPVQLSNKHLFCGPNSRQAISKMLSVVSAGILSGDMAAHLTAPWPKGRIKPRDAHGLAYHILSVLISYRRCFDLKQCHLLIEVFQTGLNSQASSIKCCLHALSLSTFELQSSVTKYLPKILEMLSQIMSNANMAVHILSFLCIVGSLPPLYANFTEDDHKMVFGVALQYLQHYNRLDSPTTSWALSQHVRILSYTVVYVWFLALKLPDRPHHIPYITRQLLLANEGKEKIDDPTEVCFDWLARYTYASADPRPAPSVFNDLVMNPPSEQSSPNGISERTWVLGHSVITIRTLVKRGWVEVLSRRPSGFSKFLCRVENLPMVGLGDVDPDLFSIPATLMMERSPSKAASLGREDLEGGVSQAHLEADLRPVFEIDKNEDQNVPPRPNPITGYVWSGTAPSQRRKEVTVDPSYVALQLSSYPERPDIRVVTDPAAVARFVSLVDRIPVIDTHKVGILYVAPGQSDEVEILRNAHGSPSYTRFLGGLGRLINLRGQVDVYAGGLDPDEDGEYAYAWWDDIGQILYHAATMMPSSEHDPQCNNKKRHIGNDHVRIIWNESGLPYQFDTLSTQFQFINIVIEPHSLGTITTSSCFSDLIHEPEYFKVTMQRAAGMPEFAPIGHFKLISAESLPLFIRQLSHMGDWFALVFAHTQGDTERVEVRTNWRRRLESIRRFRNTVPTAEGPEPEGVTNLEAFRDFTRMV